MGTCICMCARVCACMQGGVCAHKYPPCLSVFSLSLSPFSALCGWVEEVTGIVAESPPPDVPGMTEDNSPSWEWGGGRSWSSTSLPSKEPSLSESLPQWTYGSDGGEEGKGKGGGGGGEGEGKGNGGVGNGRGGGGGRGGGEEGEGEGVRRDG